jgi:energy-coupling factor transport system permease protein
VAGTAGPSRWAVLARRAPLAKVLAMMIFSVPVLASRDFRTLLCILLITVLSAPFFGSGLRALLRRSWPVLIAAAGIVITLSLFSADRSGTTLLHFGPFLITTSVLLNSLSLALRLLALSLPALLVFASTDPSDLARSLIQHAKVSPRFAIGSLAAFRLMTLFGTEWQTIHAARRARGLRRAFVSTAFALLVGAIRRGVRLAVAMDARGFDSGAARTLARPQRFGFADALLIAASAALATLALLLPRLLS